MKQMLTILALAAVTAAPVSAREYTQFTGTPQPEPESVSDVVLEYDGGASYLLGFGGYYTWTQNTVVNFAAPAGGPWLLDEAQYYLYTYGAGAPRPAEVWNISALGAAPVSVAENSINWSPPGAPSGFQIVDISGYGLNYNAGDLFGVGTAINRGDAIALYYAFDDANPGFSWSYFYGTWYDDTNQYGIDDGIRAGVSGGPTPVLETTWGGVKSLYR